MGVIVAAITPRRSGGDELDLGAALEVVDFLCAQKVDGIALLGSTGEFLHFGLEDRARFVALAAKRSRVPVYANVSHSTYEGAVALADEAASAGVAGLLLMPPYFFRYQQDEVQEFYLRFAQQVAGRVPLFLYNIPFFTTPIEADTAVSILSTGLFAGIKDSSGQFEYLERVMGVAGVTVFVGNDTVFVRGRKAGAAGVVSGVAGAAPELMLGLERAILAGDEAKTDRLSSRLNEFIAWIDRFPTPIGLKAACEARQVKAGRSAIPLPAGKQHELGEFQEWFKAWLPEVQREACG